MIILNFWLKTIKKYFYNKSENYIFTRSDWIAYFAAKKGNKVIFECHQRSRTRDFVIRRINNLQNVAIIFLNENLRDSYPSINNSIVLHNGVDHELFDTQNLEKRKSIVFVGSLSRFNESRGLPDFIKTYKNEKLYESYNLEIVGGNIEEIKELKHQVSNLTKLLGKVLENGISNTTNNNTNCNNTNINNSMTVNVYLNDHCKDALNIKDFVDQIVVY